MASSQASSSCRPVFESALLLLDALADLPADSGGFSAGRAPTAKKTMNRTTEKDCWLIFIVHLLGFLKRYEIAFDERCVKEFLRSFRPRIFWASTYLHFCSNPNLISLSICSPFH